MGLKNKFKKFLNLLFSLPITIWFNFKNFPFKNAIKLPVFLCMPTISGKGRYQLPERIYPGMIRLGFPMVSVFRGKGIVLENRGLVIFKGNTVIGGGSGISVGEKGTLIFGDRFSNQTGAKIICYHKVIFGERVRLGWQTLVCDTDFHRMKSEDGLTYTKGFGKIEIGDDVWMGSYCKIFKNTKVPSKCTVASDTLLNKEIDCRPYSLIYSGGGIKTKYTGFSRDLDDDIINYDSKE